jgi:putative transcriptional regulator
MTRSDYSGRDTEDDAQGRRSGNLTGKVLIAMPGMADPRFAHSVVLICAHGDEGAMGIVLNKPLPGIGFSDLLGQLGIPAEGRTPAVPVHFGGPVEPGRGFVLHPLPEGDDDGEGTLRIPGLPLAMTTTRNILEDIASGKGPERAVLSLGYAGWEAGQLETEMLANGWLMAEADDELIFGTDNAQKWQAALKSLGVDPLALSTAAGRA